MKFTLTATDNLSKEAAKLLEEQGIKCRGEDEYDEWELVRYQTVNVSNMDDLQKIAAGHVVIVNFMAREIEIYNGYRE